MPYTEILTVQKKTAAVVQVRTPFSIEVLPLFLVWSLTVKDSLDIFLPTIGSLKDIFFLDLRDRQPYLL